MKLKFPFSRCATPARKVAFLHIPKCAGSSINRHLKRHFGSKRSGGTFMMNSVALAHQPSAAGGAGAGASYVTGHCGWDHIAPLRETHFRFTVIRHPASRILSLYRFSRNLTDEENTAFFPVAAARSLSFEDFCHCGDPAVRMFIDNAQARTLAADYTKLDDQLPGDWRELALAHLRELDFVGTTAKLDDQFALLCRRIGLPAPGTGLRRNVGGGPAPDLPGLEEATRILGARIEADMALYEEALALAPGPA